MYHSMPVALCEGRKKLGTGGWELCVVLCGVCVPERLPMLRENDAGMLEEASTWSLGGRLGRVCGALGYHSTTVGRLAVLFWSR